MNPKRTFRCALCRGTFETAWTEAEALAEMKRNYPGLSQRDAAITCDACHGAIRNWVGSLDPADIPDYPKEH